MALSPFLMPCISRQDCTCMTLMTDSKPRPKIYGCSGFGNARLLGFIPVIREPSGRGSHSLINLRQGPYCLRLASSAADRMDAFRLRFLVFNWS